MIRLDDEHVHIYAIDVTRQTMLEGAKRYRAEISEQLEQINEALIRLSDTATQEQMAIISSVIYLPVLDG